jgi:hypothetical protein
MRRSSQWLSSDEIRVLESQVQVLGEGAGI